MAVNDFFSVAKTIPTNANLVVSIHHHSDSDPIFDFCHIIFNHLSLFSLPYIFFFLVGQSRTTTGSLISTYIFIATVVFV